MRLSGVDPGIIRELSGIYKPFIKAFKELISNSYDADAKTIAVSLSDDFRSLDVVDDGIGMTPYEFHHDFARLGGSTAWLRGGKSPSGRPRIGYKGIGFLAVARYCSALHVETLSHRPYRGSRILTRRNRKTLPIGELVDDLVPFDLLDDAIKVTGMVLVDDRTQLREGKDYEILGHGIRLRSKRALVAPQHEVKFDIDCRRIILEACLDFDYLLSLEHRADLRVLEDFCTVKLRRASSDRLPYTRVRLHRLKDFVVKDLGAAPAKGKARNILFKSGRDQFLWRLARSSPIRDDIPAEVTSAPMQKLATIQREANLPEVIVKWRKEDDAPLTRRVYLPRSSSTPLEETVIPVEINEAGLRVVGYILARSEVIYPAELRGVSVRVRNVAIGDATFFGWEHILSGPRKAALSQITGELLVLEGLEAADAINPGRESFYEESPHYRVLRRVLVGSDETIGGLVGLAIRSILDRIHVRSQVTERVGDARQRRKTLADISSAVNFYARGETPSATGLTKFFEDPVRANGLAAARDVCLRPVHKLAGFELEDHGGLGSEYEIDFDNRRIRVDFQQDTWSTSTYLNGHYYEVLFKQGRPEQPICEIDNVERRVYVNWGHPVKLHMDDVAFLRSAILLRLAYHAAPADANAMMELALNMLAFRAE